MACWLATSLVPVYLSAEDARPELREAVAEGRIVPLTTILDWLDARYRGQVIEVELEVHDDELVYEIDLLGPSGQRVEFLFDAATGELRGVRGVNVGEMRRDGGR